jgi:tRNA U55 pseudouridine synthase TruB
MPLQKGDVVVAVGRLKKVVDFLASADKETIRLLISFFEGDASGPTDAKKLAKPVEVKNVYHKEMTVEVGVSKTAVWEEREEYFAKLDVPAEPTDD